MVYEGEDGEDEVVSSPDLKQIPDFVLKVRQSRKQIMVSSILPKNERWDNFQYIN